MRSLLEIATDLNKKKKEKKRKKTQITMNFGESMP